MAFPHSSRLKRVLRKGGEAHSPVASFPRPARREPLLDPRGATAQSPFKLCLHPTFLQSSRFREQFPFHSPLRSFSGVYKVGISQSVVEVWKASFRLPSLAGPLANPFNGAESGPWAGPPLKTLFLFGNSAGHVPSRSLGSRDLYRPSFLQAFEAGSPPTDGHGTSFLQEAWQRSTPLLFPLRQTTN